MLNIFQNYVKFHKDNNILMRVNKLLFFNKKEEDSKEISTNDFSQLLRHKNYNSDFEKFLKVSYSKEEVRDYFIIFHLLYLDTSNFEKIEILQIFKKVCTEFQPFKLIEEFVKRRANFNDTFFSNEVKDLKLYINDNIDFKKSWNNLIKKNEPGLLINLGKSKERIDILMSLQNYSLTTDDILLIENESNLLKKNWVNYYQNQMVKNILHTSYSSEDEEKKSKIKAYIHINFLLNYYRENGVANQVENIELIKNYIRNIELVHIVEMRNKLYIDNFDSDSLLNTKECRYLNELVYMEKNIVLNKQTNKNLIKF